MVFGDSTLTQVPPSELICSVQSVKRLLLDVTTGFFRLCLCVLFLPSPSCSGGAISDQSRVATVAAFTHSITIYGRRGATQITARPRGLFRVISPPLLSDMPSPLLVILSFHFLSFSPLLTPPRSTTPFITSTLSVMSLLSALLILGLLHSTYHSPSTLRSSLLFLSSALTSPPSPRHCLPPPPPFIFAVLPLCLPIILPTLSSSDATTSLLFHSISSSLWVFFSPPLSLELPAPPSLHSTCLPLNPPEALGFCPGTKKELRFAQFFFYLKKKKV